MRINGKQDDFSREDFYMVAKHFNIGNKDSVNNTIDEIRVAINRWPVFAAEAGVPDQTANAISKTFRTISN
jgi:serine/threonine-protein kinase HipA